MLLTVNCRISCFFCSRWAQKSFRYFSNPMYNISIFCEYKFSTNDLIQVVKCLHKVFSWSAINIWETKIHLSRRWQTHSRKFGRYDVWDYNLDFLKKAPAFNELERLQTNGWKSCKVGNLIEFFPKLRIWKLSVFLIYFITNLRRFL